MTRIVSSSDRLGARHYFVRGSTKDCDWRPACGEIARLVEVLPTELNQPQAAVGDIVEVIRSNCTPGLERRGVHLSHWGGSNARAGERLPGTFGVWEHLVPIELKCNGSELGSMTSEDRVGVLVAAVRGLTTEERMALMEKLHET